jgi:hypothetical protein
MPQIFEDLNKHTVFTKVKSQSEALKMRDEAREKSLKKNVVIFYEKGNYTFLKPGQDPYQFRKELDEYLANPIKTQKSAIITNSESVAPKTETTSTATKTSKSISKK